MQPYLVSQHLLLRLRVLAGYC
uniref:Uncharacterized protein n=1 Tax=Rhizophora mucronata TaxID=61149 RepID=A0A2P2P211_RHIMU